MGRALPVAAAQQQTPLRPGALVSLVLALAVAQLGLLALVDCEASVVGASVFECAFLVSRPRVLGPLAASPRWLLWLVVVLGHTLCALCALFFFASLAHWLRHKAAARAAPAAAKPQPRPPSQLSAMTAEPPVELASGGWADAVPGSQPRATPPPRAIRSPALGGGGVGGGGADAHAHAPIVDQRSLERFLQSAQPLARRLSSDQPLGSPQQRAANSPQLGASGGGGLGGGGGGGGSGRLGGVASPFFSPVGACSWGSPAPAAASWGSPPPFAGLGGYGQPHGGGGGGAFPLQPSPQTFALQPFAASPQLFASPSQQPFGSPQPLRWSTPPQWAPSFAYAPSQQSQQQQQQAQQQHAQQQAAAWLSPSDAGVHKAASWQAGAAWLSPDTPFQKAMYVPASGDRLDLAAVHERRAAALLRLLAIAPATLDRWRDALRVWLAAVVFKPLVALCEANEAAVRRAAASGVSAPAPAAPAAAASPFAAGFGGGGGGGLFGGGGAMAAAAKPVAAASGAPLSPARWLAANPTHALAHQAAKLDRFFALPSAALGGGAAAEASAAYVKRRVRELARGHCLACYRWDGGGGGGVPGGASESGWESGLPTDAEVLMHVAGTFFDYVLPPPPPGTDGRPPKAAAPVAAAAAGGGLFGGGFGGAAGGGGLFGGGAWGSAAAAPAAPAAPAAWRNEAFWVAANESVPFRARHFCPPGQPAAEQARSAVVIVQRRSLPGAGGAAGATRAGAAAHYDLLETGVPWPVGAGERNAFDCLVLLALHCEKRAGLLGRVRMDVELHTAFRAALMPEPAAALPLDEAAVYRPFLSVLHPWSAQLESVRLDAVNAALVEASASARA